MQISSCFDSGAIEVVRLDDPADIRLRLRKDNAADFHQWFHFRLTGAAGKPVRMVFENAASAAYPDGWRDYHCVVSYDRQHWFRIARTRYENGELIVDHTPERDSVYYAYFEPYSHERHLDLVARVEQSPHARARKLGSTVDGRDLDLVVVGDEAPGRVPIWIIARQHPGETMAEWFVEGLIERLLDGADPVARKLREHALLYIVPNMNPDGAVRGNLRTNAAGRNLNREWRTPDEQASPEVFQAFQAAAAAFAFDEVRGIREHMKFIENESRDDERIFEKPSFANAREAAIDQDIGVDEQALFFDAFLPEAHVRDEQGEFLAVGAQGEGDAKESESAINSDLKNLLALSLGLDVAGLEERQFTEPDAGNEPSAE